MIRQVEVPDFVQMYFSSFKRSPCHKSSFLFLVHNIFVESFIFCILSSNRNNDKRRITAILAISANNLLLFFLLLFSYLISLQKHIQCSVGSWQPHVLNITIVRDQDFGYWLIRSLNFSEPLFAASLNNYLLCKRMHSFKTIYWDLIFCHNPHCIEDLFNRFSVRVFISV